MSESEQRAILTIALMTAFSDGMNDERERIAVEKLTKDMNAPGLDTASIYQDVLLRKPALEDVVKPLGTPQSRQLAYEMAVGVAHADGATSATESAFLANLAAALGVAAPAAQSYVATANAIATTAVAATMATSASSAVTTPPTAARPTPDAAQLEQQIVNAAITNAALELLPESLASMAIIPLQMKLVYRVGQAYGYELDSGSVKDFLATLGVGLTAQYLEQFGRKLLGGLLGSIAGGIGRSIGNQVASSGMAFASTWALGQVAVQYYSGGRTLDADKLRAAFGPMVTQARELGTRYARQIQQRAQSIDLKNLPAMIGRA
ncbi:MAG: GTPase [Betaproteobacteria bacterium]